jgi:hypothetical protein
MAEEKRYREKVYINLHKSFCNTFPSKVDGSMVNRMTIPKGTVLNEEHIGGCRFMPKYMSENNLDKSMMTATFYISEEGKGSTVRITNEMGWTKKVDVYELKDAIDRERQQYAERMALQEMRSKEKVRIQEKERDVEID